MLQYFIEHYYSDISEKIEQQQITYGLARIHSHRHISRCIIYADWYANLLGISECSVDRLKLFFAIAFHDIGREGELEDVWESKSRQICNDYLKTLIIDKSVVNNSEDLIIYNNIILSHILHDVDCLDIMRSGAGRGGIMGFDRNYLILFRENTFMQEKMISNAWNLISLTDGDSFENKDCLKRIFELKLNEWK